MLWINGKMTDLTKKDAIHKLVDAKSFLERYSNSYDKWTEAINIGIEAIEIVMAQEEQDPTTKNDLGVDDEERTLALMYLEQIKEDYIEGVGYERYPVPEYYAIETAIKSLALPSVTPQEPRWIPVSKRLPKEGDEILMNTVHFGVITGVYDSKFGFMTHYSLSSADMASVEVIAWMPLPEPYKAESENKNVQTM